MLQPVLICSIEGGEFRAVDVEDCGDVTFAIEYGNDDFRTGKAATGNVAGKLFYIGYDNGLAMLPGCAAHPKAIADVHTGYRPLKGT